MILLAAMLTMTGCEFRSDDPEIPVQNDTEDTQQNSTETEKSASDANYAALYQPVLDEFYKLASCYYDFNTVDEHEIPQGGTALLEGNGWGSSDKMLWEAGYMFRDLSGDGIPELVIGSVADRAYEGYRTMLYALYTIAEGQPQFVLEGAYRNAYYLMDEGTIFNRGSAGAAYSIFGLYNLSADGKTLVCRDYWFTHEKDDNYEDIRCWYNTTGEMDPAVSEELSMTLDKFWAEEQALADKTIILDMTTFGKYGGLEKPVYAENPMLQAVYGSDYSGKCDRYSVEEGDYAVDVVFLTDGAVRDFKVISLTVTDVSDDGDVSFAYDDLYLYGELKPDKGFSVKMSLPETIPFYGISYTDGMGNTRIFSVNLSGFDGSVYLAEIGGVD